MLKAFLKDSALYGGANILARGIQIALVPLYTRVLVPNDYGVIDMMMVAGTVAQSLVTLEIAWGVARAHGDAKTPAERAAYASTAFWFTVAAAIVVSLTAFLGGGLGTWLIGSRPASVFRVASVAIACQFVFGILSVHLRFELRAM